VGEIRSDQSTERREERGGKASERASEEGASACFASRTQAIPNLPSPLAGAEVCLAVVLHLSPDGPAGEFHHPPAQVSPRLDSVGAGSDLTRAGSLRWTRRGQILCVSHRIS
jgi:hypothetical protein